MSEKPLKAEEVAIRYGAKNDAYQLVSKAHEGLPADAFFDILKISGLSKEELSGLLDVSFKTIQRYQKEGKKLNSLNSEQLLKMLGLYQQAEDLFGNLGSFNNWLHKPAIGLGGKEPLQFLKTSGGIDLVANELKRIEFGALA